MTSNQTCTATCNNKDEYVALYAVGVDNILTDAYTDTLEVECYQFPNDKLIIIKNTDHNYAVDFKIYGTLEDEPDELDWCLIEDEQEVSTQSITYKKVDEPWRRLLIRCKCATGGQTGKVKVSIRSEQLP